MCVHVLFWLNVKLKIDWTLMACLEVKIPNSNRFIFLSLSLTSFIYIERYLNWEGNDCVPFFIESCQIKDRKKNTKILKQNCLIAPRWTFFCKFAIFGQTNRNEEKMIFKHIKTIVMFAAFNVPWSNTCEIFHQLKTVIASKIIQNIHLVQCLMIVR